MLNTEDAEYEEEKYSKGMLASSLPVSRSWLGGAAECWRGQCREAGGAGGNRTERQHSTSREQRSAPPSPRL